MRPFKRTDKPLTAQVLQYFGQKMFRRINPGGNIFNAYPAARRSFMGYKKNGPDSVLTCF
jgi:hypothetical protein